MDSLPKNKHIRNMVIVFYIALFIAAAFLFQKYVLRWVAPFLLAFLLALLIDPLIRFSTEKLKLNRRLASGVIVLLSLTLLSFLLYLAGSRLFTELTSFTENFPQLLESLKNSFNSLEQSLTHFKIEAPPEFTGFLDTIGESLLEILGKIPAALSSQAITVAGPFVTAIPSVIISVVVSIVATFLISAELPSVKAFLMRQLPQSIKGKFYETKAHLIKSAWGLVKAQLTLTAITFCELFIGFMFIGVDYAFLFAILTAIFDALPVLGVGGILIPWSLISLISGDYVKTIGFLVLYGVIFIVRQFLEPRIIGGHIGLPPIVTLISMYIGLKTFGIIGAFLFPIIVITLKYLQDKGYVKIWK